jgi:hypothetical protein
VKGREKDRILMALHYQRLGNNRKEGREDDWYDYRREAGRMAGRRAERRAGRMADKSARRWREGWQVRGQGDWERE